MVLKPFLYNRRWWNVSMEEYFPKQGAFSVFMVLFGACLAMLLRSQTPMEASTYFTLSTSCIFFAFIGALYLPAFSILLFGSFSMQMKQHLGNWEPAALDWPLMREKIGLILFAVMAVIIIAALRNKRRSQTKEVQDGF